MANNNHNDYIQRHEELRRQYYDNYRIVERPDGDFGITHHRNLNIDDPNSIDEYIKGMFPKNDIGVVRNSTSNLFKFKSYRKEPLAPRDINMLDSNEQIYKDEEISKQISMTPIDTEVLTRVNNKVSLCFIS